MNDQPSRYAPPLGEREPTLFAKIAEVQGAVGAIEPDASMEIQGRSDYRYISESKLLATIRPLLAERKVAAFVSVDSQHREVIGIVKRNGTPGTITFADVSMSITFADGESGEMLAVYGQGQGSDYGDKAVYKAITSANRYMWWKVMLVGTDGDDAAATETDYTLAAAPQPPGSPTAPQPPTPPAGASEPKKPVAAQKKLTANLLAELKALDPTRDFEAIIDEWVLTAFKPNGRGRNELSAAETDSMNRKLEATRDKLVEDGYEVGGIGGPDTAGQRLEEAGLGDGAVPGMAAAMDAAAAEDTTKEKA